MAVRRGGGHPPARRALEQALLQEVGLVDVLDRVGLLADRVGERRQPDRAAVEAHADRVEQLAVQAVEAEPVDLEQGEGLLGRVGGHDAGQAHLGEVAHPLEQPVGHARRAAAAQGNADRWDPQELLEQFAGLTWWYTQDAEVELTPEIATQVLIDMSDPRSRWYSHMRHESVPADHLFGRRLETLTLAVLSQLRSENNWHRIGREWLYGDPPQTGLGRQEAAFYGLPAG